MADTSFSKFQKSIKQIALNAVEATKPAGIYYGTVLSASPLQIQLDQRFTLTAEFLLLTSLVQDFNVTVTAEGETSVQTMHLALNEGERVILMRVQGGQKFLVLDRVREASE